MTEDIMKKLTCSILLLLCVVLTVTACQPADLTTVRNQWATVTATLNKGIAALSFDEWMERHASISPEDFVKEPHRNRFSVLLSRIAHLTEHIGQLLWINK